MSLESCAKGDVAVCYIFIARSEETQERESFMNFCIPTAPKEPEDHLQNYNANIVFFDGLICYSNCWLTEAEVTPFVLFALHSPGLSFLASSVGQEQVTVQSPITEY